MGLVMEGRDGGPGGVGGRARIIRAATRVARDRLWAGGWPRRQQVFFENSINKDEATQEDAVGEQLLEPTAELACPPPSRLYHHPCQHALSCAGRIHESPAARTAGRLVISGGQRIRGSSIGILGEPGLAALRGSPLAASPKEHASPHCTAQPPGLSAATQPSVLAGSAKGADSRFAV